ncbi:hypothetical protein LEP1GSC013_4488 [Leptospira interrogans serovar Valbuzzi str. Duyster]|nr:hypothetical protein LEP1GSC013_4488 [Leptospira interrogans serovar Valbuzzi str. Duyster]ENO73592.1 hypothetical protein LEP1GSC012_1732 [Leptospira interrogans serovar Valbuzzi str. Valbuzzi]
MAISGTYLTWFDVKKTIYEKYYKIRINFFSIIIVDRFFYIRVVEKFHGGD